MSHAEYQSPAPQPADAPKSYPVLADD